MTTYFIHFINTTSLRDVQLKKRTKKLEAAQMNQLLVCSEMRGTRQRWNFRVFSDDWPMTRATSSERQLVGTTCGAFSFSDDVTESAYELHSLAIGLGGLCGLPEILSIPMTWPINQQGAESGPAMQCKKRKKNKWTYMDPRWKSLEKWEIFFVLTWIFLIFRTND